jgi:hypothetical protein
MNLVRLRKSAGALLFITELLAATALMPRPVLAEEAKPPKIKPSAPKKVPFFVVPSSVSLTRLLFGLLIFRHGERASVICW